MPVKHRQFQIISCVQLLKVLGLQRGNKCVVYLQRRHRMSCTGPSLPTLCLPRCCPSSMPGLNSRQPWENGWGCLLPPVLGATQSPRFMSCEMWPSALWAGDHIPEMRSPALAPAGPRQGTFLGAQEGLQGWDRDTNSTRLLCQQGWRETFPGVASARQMGAITGFLKLFFNCPTKNLMQGNRGTILFIPGVILNVQKIGKALNHR